MAEDVHRDVLMNIHKEQPILQAELLSGVDRHRRWTREEKEAHVARAFASGVNVRAYMRQEDLAPRAFCINGARSCGVQALGSHKWW